jgi:hypothetical protein
MSGLNSNGAKSNFIQNSNRLAAAAATQSGRNQPAQQTPSNVVVSRHVAHLESSSPASSTIPIPTTTVTSRNLNLPSGVSGRVGVGGGGGGENTNSLLRTNVNKSQNRHTIAISTESTYDNLNASLVASRLDDHLLLNSSSSSSSSNKPNKLKNVHQSSFENSNASPLSKTPDSSNENWLSINEPVAGLTTTGGNYTKNSSGDLSSSAFAGSGTGSVGNFAAGGGYGGNDSDHEMLESNATGVSGSGLEGDESADDDLDSAAAYPGHHHHHHHQSSSTGGGGLGVGGVSGGFSNTINANANNNSYLFNDGFDDYTSKRLKAFVATTLHYEHVYLEKLNRLLLFKQYLDENYMGSQADISVIFTGIQQIKTTHDIVACKLQEYMDSLSELFNTNNNNTNTANSRGGGNNLTSSPSNTRLNQVVGSSRQATNLSPTAAYPSSNIIIKESFLSNAFQLLANIMELSFPVYLEFLKNYPKAMSILNKMEKTPNAATRSISLLSKRKSFIECQVDFNKALLKEYAQHRSEETSGGGSGRGGADQRKAGFLSKITRAKDPFNIYYSDVSRRGEEKFDIARTFSEDILRRPTKLFEFTCSLKTECMLASDELPSQYRTNMQSNIKLLFENESSKKLREKVFDEINRNIMPIEVRKNEDVVELIESNNDRKLRHLVLFGDCLACCRLKK